MMTLTIVLFASLALWHSNSTAVKATITQLPPVVASPSPSPNKSSTVVARPSSLAADGLGIEVDLKRGTYEITSNPGHPQHQNLALKRTGPASLNLQLSQ